MFQWSFFGRNLDNFFLIDKNLKSFVSANVGLARWDQSELDVVPGTNNATTNYSGIDFYKGIGVGLKEGNFSMEVEYLEHNMYYDAESFTASVRYNF